MGHTAESIVLRLLDTVLGATELAAGAFAGDRHGTTTPGWPRTGRRSALARWLASAPVEHDVRDAAGGYLSATWLRPDVKACKEQLGEPRLDAGDDMPRVGDAADCSVLRLEDLEQDATELAAGAVTRDTDTGPAGALSGPSSMTWGGHQIASPYPYSPQC